MATEEILKEFNSHILEYSKHRIYIQKAKEKADKFKADVVQKVILDHEIKASAVASAILPLVPQLQDVINTLEAERMSVRQSKEDADLRMEELQLRLEIEELSGDDFDQASSDLKAELELAGEQLSQLDNEVERISTAMSQWKDLAEEAGQETGLAPAKVSAPLPTPEPPAPMAQPEPVVTISAPVAPVVPPPVTVVPVAPVAPVAPVVVPTVVPEVIVQDGDGSHAVLAHMVEDVSSVFQGQKTLVDDRPDGEPVLAIEADEGEMGEVSAEVAFGYPPSTKASAEVDLTLEGAAAVVPAGEEIDISPAADGAADGARDNRRALLLYQEGTAEEQIYPFTGDLLTIGRGRDNDIQIKNDSKVSRYHCKLFRRGSNFYIEDNKSSNGTLVNGELITERRLFGGEEVIIGETFFRFRIME